MLNNQDHIISQVNNSINVLSQKIKEKHPDLSWKIQYEQQNMVETSKGKSYKINVAFSKSKAPVLDLCFHLDEQDNLSIDGGLVDDQKLLDLLVQKNIFSGLNNTIKSYLINSKDLVFYSAVRLKSILSFQKDSISAVKVKMDNIMAQIETVFITVMSQVHLQAA